MNLNNTFMADWLETNALSLVVMYGKRKFRNQHTTELFSVDVVAKQISTANPDITNTEALQYLNGLDVSPKQKEQLNRVSEVESDLEELNIKQNVSQIITWTIDNVPAILDEVIHKIWYHRQVNGKEPINRQDIGSILIEMDNAITRKLFTEFKTKIAYQPNLPDKFEELSRLISGDKYDRHYPIVLKHIIWTIKRRVNGLPDYCPVFVSIYGGAGKGKTEALKALFSILPPNRVDISKYSKNLFEDERQAFRFVQYYVCIMDELVGLSKAEINSIKNAIDTTKVVYRMLGFNKSAEGKNNAQLIGTSNTRLRNTILTDTDIRKWAEIEIAEWPDNEVTTKLVEPLQKFDWQTLWQSVNENAPSPFADASVYADFKDWTSKVCQHESPTLLFIHEVIDKKPGEWVSKVELYDNWYRREVTEYPLKWANFREKCEKYGFNFHKRNIGIGCTVPKNAIEALKDNVISTEVF